MGILNQLPPGLAGYVAAEQMAQQRGANNLNQIQGVLGLQGMIAQQQQAAQMNPLQLELMRAQVDQAKNPAPVLKDMGGYIGVLNPQTFQEIGRLPKTATPDATLRQEGEDRRHGTASGSARLSAQTAAAGQALTLRGQNQPIYDPERGAFVPRPGSAPGLPAAIPVPGLPPRASDAAKEKTKQEDIQKTLGMYVEARNGLLTGLSGATSGPVSGRLPAVTSGQQVAEGGVAAMAPVLKQLFRVAGEGTFTDKDQELLLGMVPTRADHPEARKAKMENIDRIVSAKLGTEVPKFSPQQKTIKRTGTYQGRKVIEYSDGTTEFAN